ncbi:HAD family hydrolase [Sandarakinorhabdus cyanobacteriorum]|uniref:HAD family hydrolase n=1 Tax=Sandarakinorhabdus cyanobacteriorum TaxID=1981098 RepID=A0A255YJ99_9SPHN|nr:HAD-IA family hydrolase [Sandarakinorhabdus cyanobacteriorum]OYQ29261.1 HAD family hydrolase [Sandarakinorhabdus cyanobacteriorum]
MVKAVIFDFGGVITSSPFEAFARYEAANGLPAGFIRTVNATNPDHNAWALLERNEIDTAAFDSRFRAEAQALGHDVPGSHVLPLLAGDVRPGMVAALKACKAEFKVGCITNNVASEEDIGWGRSVKDILALFDHVIESSKAGVRKPDPRIYLMMCEALGVSPADCVYLDDLGINCKPAAALGMHAIKVTGEAQALADLAAATGISLSAG